MKENSNEFGADPETITLMGQGSGGWASGFHAAASASEGLAKRAIMQSGTALNPLMLFGNVSACKFHYQIRGDKGFEVLARLCF